MNSNSISVGLWKKIGKEKGTIYFYGTVLINGVKHKLSLFDNGERHSINPRAPHWSLLIDPVEVASALPIEEPLEAINLSERADIPF